MFLVNYVNVSVGFKPHIIKIKNTPKKEKWNEILKGKSNRQKKRERRNEKEGYIILAKGNYRVTKNGGGGGERENKQRQTDRHDSGKRKSECGTEPQDPLTFDPLQSDST